ncbi:MAG: menaquinone biosynthesis protein [Planctomycetota bacterium]
MIEGKLGLVPYTNAKPLQFGLREALPEGSAIEAPPSVLAEMLREGSIVAALVSSFACFERKGLRIVPEICVASDGPVQSVKVFFPDSISDANRIGLHTASLSSAALARIVFRERLGIDPEFVPWSPDDPGADVDGYLLIGDAAMTHPAMPIMLDLGEEWRTLTGLPFVYALWGVNAKGSASELCELLRDAKRRGLENIESIAKSESERLGLDPEVCLDYLSRVIHYDLGKREEEGLRAFLEKCKKHGLVSEGAEIEFVS